MTIDNFNIKVDLTRLSSAIIATGVVIDNLTITNNKIEATGTSGAASSGGYGPRNAISINYAGYRVASGGVSNVAVNNNTVTATTDDGFGVARIFRAAIAMDEGYGSFTGNDLQSVNHDIQVRFNKAGMTTLSNNVLRGGGIEVSDLNPTPGQVNITGNTFQAATANVLAPNTAVLRLKNNQYNWPVNVLGNAFYDAEWSVSMENFKNITFSGNELTPLAGSTDYHHVTVNTKSISTNSASVAQTQIFSYISNNKFNGSGAAGGTAIGFYNHDADAASFGAFDVHENSFAPDIATAIYQDNQSGTSTASSFPLYNDNIGTGASAVTTMAAWTYPILASCNWYGTTDYSTISGKVSATVGFLPYLANGTDNDVASGFQPVPNSCNNPSPSFSFTATTSNGSTGSTVNGSPATVTLDFCNGSDFTFSGFTSFPSGKVGALEKLNSTGNVTASGFPVPADRLQTEIKPSQMNAFFSNTYLNYALASGSTGSIDQVYTPYLDVNNNNKYDVNEDLLGAPVLLKYNIYKLAMDACTHTDVTCNGGSNGTVAAGTVAGALGTVSYSWKNSSNIEVGNTATVTGLPADTYTLTVTDACGSLTCNAVVAQPDPITVVYSNTPILCNGGLSTESITITGGTAPYTVKNQNGGVLISGAQAGITYHGQTYAANYTYTVTDANGCTFVFNATITQPSAVGGSITMAANPTVAGQALNTIFIGYGPQSVTLNAAGTGGTPGYTYDWGSGFSTVASKTASPTATTTYTVTIKDANSCTTVKSFTVNVIDARCGNKNDKVLVCTKPDASNPQAREVCVSSNAVAALLANGGKLGPCASHPTAITIASPANEALRPILADGISASVKLSISPNPTSGLFTLQLNNRNTLKTEVVVLDKNGRTIEKRTVRTLSSGQQLTFNLQNQPSGMYFVKVVTEGGVETVKVVIQR